MLNYILPLFFSVVALFVIYKLQIFTIIGISKHWLAGAFVLKLLAALALWFVYTQHYTDRTKADIFRYYDDAEVFQHLLKDHKAEYFKFFYQTKSSNEEVNVVLKYTNNWETHNNSVLFGNNRFIIRLNMLLGLLSLDSYGVHVVVFCFMAFMGLFWIFQFFFRQMPQRKWLLFLAVFAFPSILFWSSGILKESLILFFIGLILNCGSLALQKRKPIIRSILILLAFLFLFQTRAIVALIFLPIVLGYIWNYLWKQRLSILPYFIILFISLSLISESKSIIGKDIFGVLVEKRLAFEDIAQESDAGSEIMNLSFEADGLSILKNTPIAFINSLFRPTPWEAKGLLMWMSALENILLFFFLIVLVIFPSSKTDSSSLLWFTLLFAVANLIVVGLTTPVLGAISRYRIIGLLFLLITFIQLIDIQALQRLSSKIKKR